MKNLKLVLAIMIATMFTAKISNAQTKTTATTNDALEVKYLGEKEGYLLFEVKTNLIAKNQIFRISDIQEGELYAKYINSPNLVHLYKIEKIEGQILKFYLTTKYKEYIKTYTFSTEIFEKENLTINTLASK